MDQKRKRDRKIRIVREMRMINHLRKIYNQYSSSYRIPFRSCRSDKKGSNKAMKKLGKPEKQLVNIKKGAELQYPTVFRLLTSLTRRIERV